MMRHCWQEWSAFELETLGLPAARRSQRQHHQMLQIGEGYDCLHDLPKLHGLQTKIQYLLEQWLKGKQRQHIFKLLQCEFVG